MNTRPKNLRYSSGDAVYFHHLHCDRKICQFEGPDDNGEYQVRVEGKKRPMIVLGKVFRVLVESAYEMKDPTNEDDKINYYSAKARRGYVVVQLTTQSPTDTEAHKYQDIGMLGGRHNYVRLQIYSYPFESVCHNSKVTKVHPGIVDGLIKELNYHKMGWYRA